MTSQNKEFKGRAQLALGLAIGPRSWKLECAVGILPHPSAPYTGCSNTTHIATWILPEGLLRTTRFAAESPTSRRVGECRTTR